VTGSAFEEVRHTADWALRVQGGDLAELMLNAARGMLSLLDAEPGFSPGPLSHLEVDADDAESLLVAWLGELLYRMENRQVTFDEMNVRVEDGIHLTADMRERPLLHPTRAIKAVTYHGLAITNTPEGLTATVVFDV
jgi:SHS2 domain-containing protein